MFYKIVKKTKIVMKNVWNETKTFKRNSVFGGNIAGGIRLLGITCLRWVLEGLIDVWREGVGGVCESVPSND